MKYFKLRLFLLLLAMPIVAAGCRTAPIYNVYEVPVITTHTVKLDEIKKAIIRAGASLGWEMKPVSPGHVIGTLHLRSHTAVVDVTYNPQTYSIVYKDSVNLKYSGGQIHRNYNGWIQNLDRNIKAQLGML